MSSAQSQISSIVSYIPSPASSSHTSLSAHIQQILQGSPVSSSRTTLSAGIEKMDLDLMLGDAEGQLDSEDSISIIMPTPSKLEMAAAANARINLLPPRVVLPTPSTSANAQNARIAHIPNLSTSANPNQAVLPSSTSEGAQKRKEVNSNPFKCNRPIFMYIYFSILKQLRLIIKRKWMLFVKMR